MRILQVLPSVASESGGPVRATLANCRALHATAPETMTTLVAPRRGLTAAWESWLRDRLPSGMEMELFPSVGRGAFSFSPQLLRWARDSAGIFDVVVVQTMFNPVTTSAAWAARRAGVPYVVVPHGTLSRYTFGHRRTILKRVFFSTLGASMLREAAAVRYTTDAEMKEAARLGIFSPGVVIPHPFGSHHRNWRRAPREPSRVLFLSRLHPVKGLDVLLPAFAQLLRTVPRARLALAGSGPQGYEQRIRSRIQELGLEPTVSLPGFVERGKKERLLAESDVFVLPSRHESFGIAVVEAMDAGLPVVISRGVDIWRDVDRAGAGLVVDGAVRPLAEALRMLLSDSATGLEMGRAGQRLVREQYAPARIGSQLAAFYREVAGARPVSRAFA